MKVWPEKLLSEIWLAKYEFSIGIYQWGECDRSLNKKNIIFDLDATHAIVSSTVNGHKWQISPWLISHSSFFHEWCLESSYKLQERYKKFSSQ